MFSNFIIALEAVLPMFILMAIGVLVKERRLMEPPEIKKMNHMVFVVFFSGNDVSQPLRERPCGGL